MRISNFTEKVWITSRTGSKLMWITVALALVAILCMPLLRYFSVHSAFFDLGQYTTNFVIATYNWDFGIIFRGHAQPIMLAVIPIFSVAPMVETLLISQSLVIVCGISLFGQLWNRVGAGPQVMGSALLAVSISTWSSALFDYHFEQFLFVLYPLFFLCLERRGVYAKLEIVAIAVAICFVKETYALTAAGLGIYVAIWRPNFSGAGYFIILFAAAYFFMVTMWIIPLFSDGRQSGDLWHEAFSYLGRTPLEIGTNLAQQPWLLVEQTFGSLRKTVFLLALLSPFLITLRRAPALLIPALPNLAILLLSQSPNHSNLSNQYTVAITLPMLVALSYSIGFTDRILNPKPVAFMLQTSRRLLFSVGFGGSFLVLIVFGIAPGSRLFWSPTAWSFNLAAYIPTSRDATLRTMVNEYVPIDPSVVVASQNTLHLGRLSLRTHALPFPQGVFEPVNVLSGGIPSESAVPAQVYADYVVLDLKRPWYISDRLALPGTDSGTEFLSYVAQLSVHFILIAESEGFQIWRQRDH